MLGISVVFTGEKDKKITDDEDYDESGSGMEEIEPGKATHSPPCLLHTEMSVCLSVNDPVLINLTLLHCSNVEYLQEKSSLLDCCRSL